DQLLAHGADIPAQGHLGAIPPMACAVVFQFVQGARQGSSLAVEFFQFVRHGHRPSIIESLLARVGCMIFRSVITRRDCEYTFSSTATPSSPSRCLAVSTSTRPALGLSRFLW